MGNRKMDVHVWPARLVWRLYRAFRLNLTYEAIAKRIGTYDAYAVRGKIRRMRSRDPVRWARRPCDGRWASKRKIVLTGDPGRVPSPARITHVNANDGVLVVAAPTGWLWQQEDLVIGWKVNVPENPLLELKNHHCKWPIGDVGDPDFGFCCSKRLDKSPYCGRHTRMAMPGLRVGVDRPREEARP